MRIQIKCAVVIILAIMLAPGSGRAASAKEISGTFIQLNRQAAECSPEQWKALLTRMQAVGIDTLIVQWTAESPVLYFKDKDLPFKEQYDTIERLMEAARGMSFSIFLGLQNDPAFWKEITARDKALRDYFLVRQAQNERVQAALLKSFGKRADWVGYYIPDEIDDLSWREGARRSILKDYLCQTVQSLRKADTNRAIAVSAFFRGRTAPAVVTDTFRYLTSDIGLNYLLIQDGAGNNDPPLEISPIYYRSLLGNGQWRMPELWIVLEAFRQISGKNESFAAEPAPPERFSSQIRAGSVFQRRVIFSFPEYMSPERGSAAKALYESLKP
ncbi:MAG: DUF4434 domain-containing protein [Kiritimatiellia bacterium]|nr:DUF4434 domain-containing protein [Kiritimatiellia bacterium]